jgi:hypothetical protein
MAGLRYCKALVPASVAALTLGLLAVGVLLLNPTNMMLSKAQSDRARLWFPASVAECDAAEAACVCCNASNSGLALLPFPDFVMRNWSGVLLT